DADAVGQTRLDAHVHVFQIDAPVELSGFDLALDLLQTVDDGVTLGHGQHARLLKHGGVGDRTHDVVTVQTLVEVDGGGETGDEGIDGLAEAAAPGLVGFLDTHGRLSAVRNARVAPRTEWRMIAGSTATPLPPVVDEPVTERPLRLVNRCARSLRNT